MNIIKPTLIAIALIVSLSGCVNSSNGIVKNQLSDSDFSTVCLDGIQYWIRSAGTSFMSVRIDPATLAPKRCEAEK